MAYTLSFHVEGSRANQAHNRRDLKSVSKNGNIDSTRSWENLKLVDVPIREAYKYLFAKEVAEFNSRQTHKERCIDDYYSHIAKSAKKHTAYEMIVQIGSVKEGFPDDDRAVEALADYVSDFQDRNPNFEVIGAYIHLDEATPHLHLDYIPFAKCNRGMKKQNTLSGALKAQEFVTRNSRNTAQMQWEQAERDAIRDICRQYGIELYEQGVGRKRYLEVSEYKSAMDSLNNLNRQISASEDQIQQNVTICRSLEKKIDEQTSKLSNVNQVYQRICTNIQQFPEQQVTFGIMMDCLEEHYPEILDYIMQYAEYFRQCNDLHYEKQDWRQDLDEIEF